MAFQIAADVGFTNVVFSQSGIVPTGEGLTRLRLPDRLASGRNYYWRIKGDDGANTSGWSNPSHFEILQPIVIGVPDPQSPVANVRVSNGTPEFKVRNGQSSGPYPSLVQLPDLRQSDVRDDLHQCRRGRGRRRRDALHDAATAGARPDVLLAGPDRGRNELWQLVEDRVLQIACRRPCSRPAPGLVRYPAAVCRATASRTTGNSSWSASRRSTRRCSRRWARSASARRTCRSSATASSKPASAAGSTSGGT